MSPDAALPELSALLRETALFGVLDDRTLREIEGEIELVTLPGGQTLMREGALADSLYIVINGRLCATVRAPDGSEQAVGEVARGESVGEMALLTGGHRSATVRAVRDTHLLKLSKPGFDRLVERNPQTAIQLARLLVGRLQQTIHAWHRARVPGAVAVVSAGGDVALSPIVAALVAAFAALGSTFHLSRATVDEALGRGAAQIGHDHADNAKVVGWLSEREAQHQFVIYEADAPEAGAAPSAWTGRCLREADRILVVGQAGPAPPIGAVEAQIWPRAAELAVPRELVLVHREDGGVAGTGDWLCPPRRFDMHHHVRTGSSADFARLARMLSGRALGLVLGGGGARAFAHIGVLRALAEARIAVDLIGGTSMGAVIAAQYAAGWDHRAMVEANRQAFVERGSLFDYTLPLMSLIGGQRFVRAFATMFGETRIEDLPLKFFCVSTNLTRGELRVHETGALYRWLAASICVPGLAPPVPDQGDLLVDGSVLDTVPADVMRRYGRGPVVAVDVTAREDVRVDPGYVWPPSAWRILWSRLNPLAARIQAPSLYTILLRTTMLSSVSAIERLKGQVDLYIHPPVEQFELLDWKSLDRIVDLGYESGRQALTGWKAGAGSRPR